MLGIPEEPFAIDWNKVIFNMLTINGIYGREMYETWYKMTAMLQSGWISRRSSRIASADDSSRGSTRCARRDGQGDPELERGL